jgi:hypothetical protein
MTIYRGPGGTGTASSEVDTTEYQEFLVQAQAAKVAAEAARDAALAAETNAELAETNAELAETSAITAGNAAQDWATKTSGPVAGGEYSAKYNAQLAAASAAASEAALDAFDDRYLGAKASDPTVDNDGNALVTGTQYFNTVGNEIKVYNGTSWQSASVIGGTVTNLTVTNPIVGTVTNGVVTTGSYANPSWLTSLAWGKVTGTPTTIAGYGITNAYTKTEVDTALAGKLATTAGAVGTTNLADLSVTPAKLSQKLTQATVVNSTSGTAIDFTSIPAWVKRITVMFSGVSVSGGPLLLVQLGSGSITTSGYTSIAFGGSNANTLTTVSSSSGFAMNPVGAATYTYHGSCQINLLSSNTWTESGTFGTTLSGVHIGMGSAGSVSLSGVLDRIRITTTNGSDTFDAGSINILYEG